MRYTNNRQLNVCGGVVFVCVRARAGGLIVMRIAPNNLSVRPGPGDAFTFVEFGHTVFILAQTLKLKPFAGAGRVQMTLRTARQNRNKNHLMRSVVRVRD